MPTIKSRSVCVENNQKSDGALNISSDGLTITLTGATFETRWGEGDKIVCSGQTNYVRSKSSTTVMVMQTAFPAGMRSTNGNSYTLDRAYSGANAISAAYAACPSDLQSDDSIWDMVLYKDGGAFNERIIFDRSITTGYGTDTGYYIKLRAAVQDRHTGVRNTGVKIQYAPVTLSGTFECHIFQNPIRIEWIEWDGSLVSPVWSGEYVGAAIYMNCGQVADYGPGYFRNNLVYDWSRTSTTDSSYGVIGLSMACIYRGNYVYNNRFFCNGKSNFLTKIIETSTYGSHRYFNNSIIHKSGLSGSYHYGIHRDTAISQEISAVNNIVCGFTTDYTYYATGSVEDYNIASDTSVSGVHSLVSKTATNQFANITSATEDLNLKAGADALSAGLNISVSAENISTDVLGNTRGLVWSIGSSEKTVITKAVIQNGYYNTGGSYTVSTSAFTPAANKLYIISVWITSSYGTVSDPSVSANNGLNPVLIHKAGGTNVFDLKLWVYRAMKPSGLTNGVIQFTWAGVPVDRTRWSIEEFDGVDTGGTDGANAIVQYVSGTNLVGYDDEDTIIPLSAFSHTDNFAYLGAGAYGYEMRYGWATSLVPIFNYISETESNFFSTWVRDGNPVTPSQQAIMLDQASFQTARMIAIGLEIRAITNALPPTPSGGGNWFLLAMKNQLAYPS